MSRDIQLLHPVLRACIPKILKRCGNAGLPVLVTETFRTKEEQDALYWQGRTSPGPIVTNVKWPKSAHCWGVAFDFCRNIRGKEYDDSDGFFEKVAEIAKPFGLTWGGDWKNFVDKPHLELTQFLPGSSVNTLIHQYSTPENFMASWVKQEEPFVRYQTVKDVPQWAQDMVLDLMQSGALAGDGNTDLDARVIDLSDDMIRVLAIVTRLIEKTKNK